MEYSVKKIKVNFNPPNSVLNPLTNSDSPSLKSKGARFSSQTTLLKKMIKNENININLKLIKIL